MKNLKLAIAFSLFLAVTATIGISQLGGTPAFAGFCDVPREDPCEQLCCDDYQMCLGIAWCSPHPNCCLTLLNNCLNYCG